MADKLKMYIDGEWCASGDGAYKEIINPCDGCAIAYAPQGTRDDARRAIAAAKRAFCADGWDETPKGKLSELLLSFASLMEENVGRLARAETLNTGKALIESEYDVYDSVGVVRYYAGLANKPTGQTYGVAADPNIMAMTVREPIGVCGMISAWNFPISLAIWKIAPALAAGNTIVFKPAQITPMSAVILFELLEQAGFPKGVANLVLGSGPAVGDEIATNPDVGKVAFTGGLAAGQSVMRAAAGGVKSVSLELGGKSPSIMFADADFDTAVDYALFGMFYNQGEVCSASSRILVEDAIYDRFMEAFVAKTAAIKIGNGLEDGVRMGPLISAEHMETVLGYIDMGVKEGAKLAFGGKRLTDGALAKGFFVQPAIFTDVREDMRIVKEEIFGPVVVVQRFHGEEEAIRLANATDYGLAAGVFSGDVSKALRVVRKLRAGITWVNTYGPVYPEAPWGGYKMSGVGRELGTYGLDDYSEVKQININTRPAPTGWFGG
ncbi:MAG: aldehyde dehydrogenase family protein [Lachnospiraceae bacterium]|jgi:betaine-aldehyde dehydrogenase|nr:aldehyde dehydrogenase family protein [Lachnospiraceae bacterium]